jgi:hypothetical protein
MFVKDEILFQSSACGYPVLIAPFITWAVCSPTYVFGTLVENQFVAMWFLGYLFYSIFVPVCFVPLA